MKKASQTYRFFSALTLILFLSSVVVPASLSAASLLCGMDMSVANDGILSCNAHGADKSEVTISLDKITCNYQEVCEQALFEEQSIVEAVPQVSHDFTAILVSKDVSYPLFDDFRAEFFHAEPAISPSTPPIFLLNSSFLN